LQYVHLLRQNGTEMYNPSGIGMIMAPDGDANTLEFEPAGIFSRFGQAALTTPT